MKTKKRFLSILLSLVLMLGLMPGMSLTAYADDPYASIKNTTTVVDFDSKDWYLIDYDSSTVTLLAKECVGSSKYDKGGIFVAYESNPTVKTVVDNWYGANITADAQKAVSGNAMFLLTTAQASTINSANPNVLKCSQASGAEENSWWLCSNGLSVGATFVEGGSGAVNIYGRGVSGYTYGVRPALKLDLSQVTFDPDSNTFSIPVGYSVTIAGGANATVSGGEVNQTEVMGEMKTVTYTAKSGYKFPESSDYFKTTNGITVVRTSDTVVTVSGTPEADTKITVPDAEEVPVHRHDIKLFKEKEPTCTEDGYDEHYECTECGKWFADKNGNYEYSDSEIAELKKKSTGHKWDNGVVTVEPTYDETGIKTYTCSVCGEIKEETIPKKTRSYSNDSDNDSSGGGSGGKSGSFSTQSLDVNGNAFGSPSAGHQPDSGMPLSDRGGNWGSMANNWSYTKSDGTLARNEWLNLEYNGHTYWYFFDGNSTMQTDWLNYNGATYYFVPDMDGWRGRMATGWHQIKEKWYYFEPTAGAYQGVMYRGAVTPDGHIVGADGAWNGVGTTPESSAQTGTTASGT